MEHAEWNTRNWLPARDYDKVTDMKIRTGMRAFLTLLATMAALVAVAETLFRLSGDSGVQDSLSGVFGEGFTRCYGFLGEVAVHAPYYALFVVGPITNLILCIPFAGVLLYGGLSSGSGSNLLFLVGIVGLQVNAMIAAFNMLPVSVLDGKKVLAWNPVVFITLIVAAFGILVASFYLFTA